jgi:hypothetical protein
MYLLRAKAPAESRVVSASVVGIRDR